MDNNTNTNTQAVNENEKKGISLVGAIAICGVAAIAIAGIVFGVKHLVGGSAAEAAAETVAE